MEAPIKHLIMGADVFGCWVINAGAYTQANLAFNSAKKIKISKVTYSYNVTRIAS